MPKPLDQNDKDEKQKVLLKTTALALIEAASFLFFL
jgi:hypothetical protein